MIKLSGKKKVVYDSSSCFNTETTRANIHRLKWFNHTIAKSDKSYCCWNPNCMKKGRVWKYLRIQIQFVTNE